MTDDIIAPAAKEESLYTEPDDIAFATSPTIGQLAKAMAAAQGEMQNPAFDAENTFYSTPSKEAKYATLAAIRDAVVPAMSRHGVAVMQLPYVERGDGRPTVAGVITLAAHAESGEWLRWKIAFRPMRARRGEAPQPSDDAQSAGGATTYARRYSLQGLACVVGDYDDDANAASGITENQKTPKPRDEAAPKKTAPPKKAAAPKKDSLSEEVKASIREKFDILGLSDTQIANAFRKYGATSLDDLSAAGATNMVLAMDKAINKQADLKMAHELLNHAVEEAGLDQTQVDELRQKHFPGLELNKLTANEVTTLAGFVSGGEA